MVRIVRIFVISALWTALAAPVHAAEPFNPSTVIQQVTIFGSSVTYPPAIWITGPDIPAQSEFFRDQQGPAFLLEQIPKGESFDSWKRMYAIAGLANGDNVATMGSFFRSSLAPYMAACGPLNFTSKKLSGDNGSITYLFVCQNSPNISKFGYGDGVGEISVFRFIKAGDAMIKIYHQWRGPKFKSGDPSTWPVGQDVLNEAIRRLGMVTVSPAAG